MKTPCILVTGVGAIIGQGIIKSLRMLDRQVRIVGLDLNPDAFGAPSCDAFYAKPDDESGKGYLEFFRRLIQEQEIDMILPGIEHDVFFFDAHRDFFEQQECLLMLNHAELIDISRDKWKTARVLDDAGIEVIPGLIPNDWQECVATLGPPPLLMKPRFGNGSRGIVKLSEERDFKYWIDKSSDSFMVQKIVGSDDSEYTASVFGLGNGQATNAIVFRRRLSSNGSTLSAEVVQEPRITELIGRLNTLFRPLGPTNYQFRKEAETVYLLEVNPRISSATSFRAAFGFNEAGMCIDYFIDGKRPSPPLVLRGKAVRYIEDRIDHS